MKMRFISLLVIISFVAGISGCATIPEERKGAATGAGIGAATGAAAGAIFGEKGAKTEMALLGGLLGALVGGVIGHYTYDVKRSEQETSQRYNHQSSMGQMVRIEETSAVPTSVRPGERVELRTTYALLGTSASETLNITETREIRLYGDLVGKPEVNVTRSGGTFMSTIPLVLPADAKKGTYTVTTTIQTATAKDTRETSFAVK